MIFTDSPRRVYQRLFRPRSLAVVGASANPGKPGGRLIRNLLQNEYAGTLWAVNPGAPVPGVATVGSVEDLPGTPDLALIAIPAPEVRSVVAALARKGTRAAIVMSAGFGETGPAGKVEEQRLMDLAREAGLTLVGPNCSGFLTPAYAGKFAGILTRPVPGRIDLICGSGATMDFVVEQALVRGLAFSNTVNLGNSIQVGIEEILGLLDHNFGPESARILLLYIEQIKKPADLLRHARSLAEKGCTLVGIKSGVTPAGARAALSHTGAMATPDRAVQALFDKAGIIRVGSKTEMIDIACALTASGGPIRGNRACIVTSAGGPAVMLADELHRQGFDLPALQEKTREQLRAMLPPEATVANPLDCLPSKDGLQTRRILGLLNAEEQQRLDVVVTIDGAAGIVDEGQIFCETLQAARSGPLPIVPVICSATTSAAKLAVFTSEGGVYFDDEVSAGRALGRILNRSHLFTPPKLPPGYDPAAVGAAVSGWTGVASPRVAEAVLTAAGFRLPPQVVVGSPAELERACAQIGYPLALKAAGILHKSEVNGVRLGVSSRREAEQAYAELTAIPGGAGVLVQSMIAGTEVILGAVREVGFGHVVMVGLGGIHAEVLDDAAFGLAPLSTEEALGLIRRIRALPMLLGVRGTKGLSLDALADALVRLSRLVVDAPVITEIDLNPLKGTGDELFAVDARLVLRTGGGNR
ncbi:MAG: acetate--CoA ligase family protein [Desulfobacterales bacterium]